MLLLVWFTALYVDSLSFLPEVKWSDITSKALLIYFIIYKFSPILFSPKNMLTNPLAAFLFLKDTKATFLAVVGTGLFLWLRLRDRKSNQVASIEMLTLHAILVFAGYNLFFRDYGTSTPLPWGIRIQNGSYDYHPLHLYRFSILVCLYLYWTWRRRKSEFGKSYEYPFLLFFGGVALLSITYFDYPPKNYFFSLEQTIYISLAILGWLSLIRKHSYFRKENY